ncbi:MAG: accessory factor UbiK family protein [Alphaproteobacteria bacterium]
MQSDNRFIDDLAKVAASAVGVAAGVKDEVEARLRAQFERMLDGMDLVQRDEFDAVKAMAAEARAENERLAKRLAALEKVAGAAKTGVKQDGPRKKTGKRSRAG